MNPEPCEPRRNTISKQPKATLIVYIPKSIAREPESMELTQLRSILDIKPIDKIKLRVFGRSYGYFNQSFREKAWIRVANLHKSEFYHLRNYESWIKKIVPNKDTEIIDKDVVRSLNGIDVFSQMDETTQDQYKSSLSNILKVYLLINPKLLYYQGFNDICLMFIYVFGEHKAFTFLDAAVQLFFRDFLAYSFGKSTVLQMKLMKYMLQDVDPELYDIWKDFEFPMFSISWLLTWFAHSLSDLKIIMRIYDYLLSSPPTSIIYMCVAMTMITKKKVFEHSPNRDHGEMHSFYQKIQLNDIEIEELIQKTIKLEETVDLRKYMTSLNANFPEDSRITECLERRTSKIVEPDEQNLKIPTNSVKISEPIASVLPNNPGQVTTIRPKAQSVEQSDLRLSNFKSFTDTYGIGNTRKISK